jgi:anti-sigma factor RsiW
MSPVPISDDDLQAYADGQLDGERRDAVEQALARDASVGARIAAIRAQNAELRHAFDPWLAERVPPRLIAAAEGPTRPRRARARLARARGGGDARRRAWRSAGSVAT